MNVAAGVSLGVGGRTNPGDPKLDSPVVGGGGGGGEAMAAVVTAGTVTAGVVAVRGDGVDSLAGA